jgi:hypothetical protein
MPISGRFSQALIFDLLTGREQVLRQWIFLWQKTKKVFCATDSLRSSGYMGVVNWLFSQPVGLTVHI